MTATFDPDALGALDQMFGAGDTPAREVKRRRKAESDMTDKRRGKSKGARMPVNVRMRLEVRDAMFKAADKTGLHVTEWIEAAVLAYLEKGARHG